MDWKSLETANLSTENGRPRYERLAELLAEAINSRQVRHGDRLPTARDLSRMFSVSATTVSSAFDLLSRRGLIRAEVGRGTFVHAPGPDLGHTGKSFPRFKPHTGGQPPVRRAWRRSALMSMSARLRASYPSAVECSTGRPDPALLPYGIVRTCWEQAVRDVTPRDLQYAGPEPLPELAEQLHKRLAADGIHTSPGDLLICSSAQQVFTLMLELLRTQLHDEDLVIAVEEPGYPTVLDTFERAGAQLVGLEMDHEGVLPTSLEAALSNGAQTVLFTPRGQNPTGASWSPARRQELAEVLARHREILILEDDQVAEVASTRPGSLLNDPRLSHRVVYIRSFSKSIAPDLRIAAIAAKGPLLERLTEAKTFADGWTSRLLQRTISLVFAHPDLESALCAARDEYRERRTAAAEAINQALSRWGCGTWCGPDGVNLWVQLPAGTSGRDAVESSAVAGVRIAEGEPFYLDLGHRDTLRLNAGSVPPAMARHAGTLLANAIIASQSVTSGPIHV